MSRDISDANEGFDQASEDLLTLRRFPGVAKEFWQRLIVVAGELAQADIAELLVGRPGQTPHWAKIGEWTAGAGRQRRRAAFAVGIEEAAVRTLQEGCFVEEDDEASGTFTIGVRLRTQRAEDEVLLLAQLVDFTEAAAREALLRLQLAADTPALYLANLASRQAQADVEKFATVLDLMVPVNAEKRFLAALLAFCNGLATHFKCDRVSVAWQTRGYLRLKAMSRTEKFDRQMVAGQQLEAAMEECLDQDEEIVWPRPEHSTVVVRDHEKFAQEQRVAHLGSLPLRVDDQPVAVLTFERQTGAFTTTELAQLRLACDQAARRLGDLHAHDRWFGARLAAAARENLAKALGPEHTWAKLGAVFGAVALAALFLVRVTYRVEGNFMLRSEAVSYLTSPFDGFIDQVHVRPGDFLPKGGPILSLNRSELLLEQSAALAELGRYEREAEKARAVRAIAEMQINEALMQQARARLDLVNYRLENAVLKAAFDGVIVEGDLRERIGAPAKQGEALYKVARLDALFAEAEVNERDIKQILKSSRAEIAFVTQPKLKFAATVEAIEPAAVAKKEANVFLVRLKFDRAPEPWWRPGMTGLCKIDTEKRSLWWILTHRTVDFLRLKLWW